jgi:hypothetical protein
VSKYLRLSVVRSQLSVASGQQPGILVSPLHVANSRANDNEQRTTDKGQLSNDSMTR